MADYISREEAAKREKIKTPFARIIVNNSPEKTYYNIMWWQDGEMHIGFGSANLSFVRKWLSEEFEVESPPADVAPTQRWIPCSERLPEKGKYVLLWSEDSSGVFIGICFCEKFIVNGFWGEVADLSITHWMPLPEPPKEGGNENAV